MNKSIIPLVITSAILASCDHYDRTDGHATVIGPSVYSNYTPQLRAREVQPPVRRVESKPAAPAPAASPASQNQPRVAETPSPAPETKPVAAPKPAPAPQQVVIPSPNELPQQQSAPAAKPAPIPAPAPAAQEEQPAKPTYAVMPGQNRGLRVRPRR